MLNTTILFGRNMFPNQKRGIKFLSIIFVSSLSVLSIFSPSSIAHGMKIYSDVSKQDFLSITGIDDYTEPTLDTITNYESLWVSRYDLQSYALQSFIETGATTDGKYALAKDFLPANFGPPPHMHSLEDEWFYVQSGQLSFLMEDNELFAADPGTLIFGPRDHLHGFINNGTDIVSMLNLWQPSGIEGFFRETGIPISIDNPLTPPSSAPDPAVFIEASTKYGVTIAPPNPDSPNPYSEDVVQAVPEPSNVLGQIIFSILSLIYLIKRKRIRLVKARY
jgi:mannose-6-phosphate isomerase-like protein (cupin superfamily)